MLQGEPLVFWDFDPAKRPPVEPLYQPFPMQPRHRGQVWRHHPAYWRPRHFHREPELNFVFRGRARMGVGAHVVEMTAGDGLLLLPGQDHALLEASSDLELYVSALDPEVAEHCVHRPLPTGTACLRLQEKEVEHVRGQLHHLASTTDPTQHETIVGDLLSQATSVLAPGHPVVRKALEQLGRDPSLDGAALSQALKVHRSDLGRYVQRDLGVPLVKYRNRLRLMRFIARVDDGHTLTSAALEAGFGSYQQCHRMFVGHLGCSPRRYFSGHRRDVDELLARDAHARAAPPA